MDFITYVFVGKAKDFGGNLMTRRIKKGGILCMIFWSAGGFYDLVDPRTMTCINAEMVEGLKYGGRE